MSTKNYSQYQHLYNQIKNIKKKEKMIIIINASQSVDWSNIHNDKKKKKKKKKKTINKLKATKKSIDES